MLKLIHDATAQDVKIGETVTDFRGETAIVKGWQEPKHSGSTGRIDTDAGSYYPGVYNCSWIEA